MTPKKILHFAIGPVAGALLGVFTLPIITWSFSQEDVGRFSMLQVTLSFGVLLFSFGLDQAYVREFYEVDDRSALLKLTVLPGMMLLSVTLLLIYTLNPASLADLLFDVPQWQLSFLITVALIVSYISRFLSLILRMTERGLAFSMSQLLPKFLFLLVIAAYILFECNKSLQNLVLAKVATLTVVLFIYAWNTRSDWIPAFGKAVDVKKIKPLLKFGLPLIVGGLAFWGLTATDRIFLRWLSDYEQLGIYSVSASFAAAATVLQSVFATVWAPTVYKWESEGSSLNRIMKVTRYVLLCVVVLFSIAGLFSWVIPIVLPDGYQDVQWIVVSCLGFPLLYTLSETTVVGIGITRRSGFALLAALLAFLANICGNWYLIPLFGASGAAASTCVSFLVFLIARTELSVFVWKKIPRLYLYMYVFILVLGAVVTTLFGSSLYIGVHFFWLLVLCSVPFFFKSELVLAVGLIKRQVGRKV